jgi:hypothetical protein
MNIFYVFHDYFNILRCCQYQYYIACNDETIDEMLRIFKVTEKGVKCDAICFTINSVISAVDIISSHFRDVTAPWHTSCSLRRDHRTVLFVDFGSVNSSDFECSALSSGKWLLLRSSRGMWWRSPLLVMMPESLLSISSPVVLLPIYTLVQNGNEFVSPSAISVFGLN